MTAVSLGNKTLNRQDAKAPKINFGYGKIYKEVEELEEEAKEGI